MTDINGRVSTLQRWQLILSNCWVVTGLRCVHSQAHIRNYYKIIKITGLSLFLKCCLTLKRASITETSGLLQFKIPGRKITTYIYCTAFQWILVNTVGLPLKDVGKTCISLCSELPLMYYTEVIMVFNGVQKMTGYHKTLSKVLEDVSWVISIPAFLN